MTFKKALATSIATGALFGAILTGSAFAAELTINGTGDGSTNVINVTNSNTTTVNQINEVGIETNITSIANTGGNSIERTNGEASIDTGEANSTVKVNISGGSNTANIEPCPCDNTESAEIKNTGDRSRNRIRQDNSNETTVGQINLVGIETNINSIANSGKNRIRRGSSEVDPSITTDDANSTVRVRVKGPLNKIK